MDIFLDGHKRCRRRRSCSTLTPPTTRSTASKKVGSSMATTTAIATCRSTSSAERSSSVGAKLRPANIDGPAGAVDEVARIVARIRARRPKVTDRAARRFRLLPRGADGVVRGRGCGLPLRPGANARRKAVLAPEAWEAARLCRTTGKAARLFRDFAYQTETSWSRPRRVVGTTEYLPRRCQSAFRERPAWARKDRRPRASTKISIAPAARWKTASRNASSTCSPTARRRRPCRPANCACGSLRWLTCCSASCAGSRSATPSLPMPALGTVRLKLLKIGALVRRSVRRIKFAMDSGFPWQTEFALAYLYLQRGFPRWSSSTVPRPIQAPAPRHVPVRARLSP